MSERKWGAGDREKWSAHGTVRIGNTDHPLIWGEHPHSTQDNCHYALMGGGEPMGFSGHRILIGVNMRSHNYLKESQLSGDEVRKGGSCEILADDEVVYEFFHRDPQWALLRAHTLIGTLLEHSSMWMVAAERKKLIGRKIFYRSAPAVISHLIVEQGCVIIDSADGKPFPPPVWADDGYETEASVKDDVLAAGIWWHRK